MFGGGGGSAQLGAQFGEGVVAELVEQGGDRMVGGVDAGRVLLVGPGVEGDDAE